VSFSDVATSMEMATAAAAAAWERIRSTADVATRPKRRTRASIAGSARTSKPRRAFPFRAVVMVMVTVQTDSIARMVAAATMPTRCESCTLTRATIGIRPSSRISRMAMVDRRRRVDVLRCRPRRPINSLDFSQSLRIIASLRDFDRMPINRVRIMEVMIRIMPMMLRARDIRNIHHFITTVSIPIAYIRTRNDEE